MDTDVSSLLRFNGHAETVQKILDVVKKTAYGINFVIWGLENQAKIHYAMPLRHMIGDAFSYLKEYNEIAARNKLEKSFETSDEFLSNLKRTDRLHPVISRSIYNHDYRKINNLYHTQNISSELGMVIGAITESQQLIDHALDSELHGGEINMCTALEELRNEGIQEGEIRGTIKAYKKFHISYEDTLLNLMNEFSLSEEDAKKYLEQY